MFGAMLGGFRLAVRGTVPCSAVWDTRARRGDTLSPTERMWHYIVRSSVGRGGRAESRGRATVKARRLRGPSEWRSCGEGRGTAISIRTPKYWKVR
jgi:hypothetical protein